MTHTDSAFSKDSAPTKRTIVGVDGSVPSEVAVRWAAADAATHGTALTLVYAGVASGGTQSNAPRLSGGASSAHAHSALATAQAVAQSVAGDSLTIETVLVSTPPAEALIGYGPDARLIALGTRGLGGLARAVLGSVSSAVAAQAGCPVVIVPEHFDTAQVDADSAPVVVGLDHSPHDNVVLAVAFDQAARRHVSLRMVHAFTALHPGTSFGDFVQWGPHLDPAGAAKLWMDEVAGAWTNKYPAVQVSTCAIEDYPSRVVLEMAADAQLIVIGSRSRGAISPLFIGSTSRAVLHRAEIPTIIVPAIRGDLIGER